MTPVKVGILTGLAAAVLLGAAPQAPAQQRGGGNAPHQGTAGGLGRDGQQLSHIYIRYYPYWSRYPHAGSDPASMGTGFGQGYDYYGYLPANPPTYPRLIVIPPPPPPPLPPPLIPRR